MHSWCWSRRCYWLLFSSCYLHQPGERRMLSSLEVHSCCRGCLRWRPFFLRLSSFSRWTATFAIYSADVLGPLRFGSTLQISFSPWLETFLYFRQPSWQHLSLPS